MSEFEIIVWKRLKWASRISFFVPWDMTPITSVCNWPSKPVVGVGQNVQYQMPKFSLSCNFRSYPTKATKIRET